MDELKKEEEKYHDFLFLDVDEKYLKLPYKTYKLNPSHYCLSLSRSYDYLLSINNFVDWHSSELRLIYLKQNITSKLMMTYICALVR